MPVQVLRIAGSFSHQYGSPFLLLPSIHEFPGSNYTSHQTLPEAVPSTLSGLLGSFQQPLSASPTIFLHTGWPELQEAPPRPSTEALEYFHVHGNFSPGAFPVWEWAAIVASTGPFWSFPLHVLHFPKEVCIQLPIPWSIVLCFIEFCPTSAL